jgi:hypothetical protein
MNLKDVLEIIARHRTELTTEFGIRSLCLRNGPGLGKRARQDSNLRPPA